MNKIILTMLLALPCMTSSQAVAEAADAFVSDLNAQHHPESP